VAAIAAERFRPGDLSAPEPLYLRPPDATLPKAEGRRRP
ncbi:MAG: tRNA (adenosine(37)-N6)-threonylcarbamoyltransferase complex dimerization subunit type 1 TsaB, partial [Alphaproteobacteria bacterium]|nr:tRNA (adenosine(37)-N6)-threonylcarbamoyltransferase complex dimerization subunit type 1 TsaB [Alphaproteobacteria bacterium]